MSFERIKRIFDEVQELTGPRRERRLGELCGDDAALRAQVEALLAADAVDGDFLDTRAIDGADPADGAPGRAPALIDASQHDDAAPGLADASAARPPALFDSPGLADAAGIGAVGPDDVLAGDAVAGTVAESAGDHIGPYKLLQVIGEGGFGVVFMAEQERPMRRRVALKIVKPGMDTKQVIARFEAERQALAILDHPNIAKVFEAGTTPTGRPYFVMELVRGIPITDYCDENKLDTRERLALFAVVCKAVDHAHKHGIIHRDIKPSNVLVTLHDGEPVPKIIDFGVAKATHQRLTESTLFTDFHAFIGTPAYMSPEQAAYEGLEIDGRSDVYSLGVLLYELLTGTTPFDARTMKRAAYFEVLRILKEEEPPKPSTRISALGKASAMHAKQRGSDPSGLVRMLRGDLDWIVMKALEKDRRRRYESATEFAADIGRYFDHKPIVARRPSTLYRARKLVRRRWGPFATAAVALLALAVDVAYVNWQNGRAPVATAGPVGAQMTELLFSSDDRPCYQEATPSPTGDLFAYVGSCPPGIYVFEPGSLDDRLISAQEWHSGLAWSPDGTSVITSVSNDDGGRLTVIDVSTGAAHTPPQLEGISLQPTSRSSDNEHVAGFSGPIGDITTSVVSMRTGEVTVLAHGVQHDEGFAQFSPDGRFVLFSDMAGATTDLFVTELATGERWLLAGGGGAEGGSVWSPDGGHVLFRNDGGTWTVPVANGRPAGEPRLLRNDRPWPHVWNEDGFFFVVENQSSQGYRIPVDAATGGDHAADAAAGSARAGWRTFEIPLSVVYGLHTAWAPDMSRHAIFTTPDFTLRIRGPDGERAIPLGLEIIPSNMWWSQDGSEVLLTSWERESGDGSDGTVWAVNANDGAMRRLLNPLPGLRTVHLSPDGRHMVSVRAVDARGDRLILSEFGEVDGMLLASASSNGAIWRPLFSPDGTHVLFQRAPASGTPVSLWVIGTDGSGERMLASADGIGAPVWDPTGRMIAYPAWQQGETLTAEGTHALMVVSLDDGSVREIEGFSQLENPRLLGWTPDGAWLEVSEKVGRKEYWVNRDILGSGGG